MQVVIIGNGVAGTEAALTVRARHEDWEIAIVSEESDHFFSRTALMYLFCGQMSPGDIEPYERDLYERMHFKRIRARAVDVDVELRQVRLAGGLPPLAYDRLLIACGSRPRAGVWPHSDLQGIGHFVTLQDLEWLEQEVYGHPGSERPPRPDAHLAMTTADSPYQPRPVATLKRGRPARRAVVVGGGLIGLEVVEVLHHAGVEVHFLIMEDWYWPLALDQRESRWMAEVMKEKGVHVHLQTQVEEFFGDEQGLIRGVRTKDGRELDCDLVVITIGVVPNTQWLEGSGIALDERFKGIVVDEGLGTSASDVFAAGDCATVRWFNGAQRPEQLWYTSRAQGRVAGRRLLGDQATYQRGTFYNSAKFMDVEYTTAGLVNFNLPGETDWFHEEQGNMRSTTRLVVQENQVVGFNMLGRRWNHEVLVRWIEERRAPDYVLDHLHEALYDAEFTPLLEIPDHPRRGSSLFKRLVG